MPKLKYLGPAAEFNDKPVPEDGLEVTLTDAQVTVMREHNHRFDTDDTQSPKPTPQAVNAAVNPETGEADLVKATKASAAAEAADKK